MIRTIDEGGEIVIFKTNDGLVTLDVKFRGDSIWLTQGQIAKLFNVNDPAISKHVKNIYRSGELDKKETLSKMETVRTEGGREVKRSVIVYNPDMVKSLIA